MNDSFGMEAVRLQVVKGKLKIGVWPGGGTASSAASCNWGRLYPVCHVINDGGDKERLCDRIEGVARETYRRSPGGVTNRLRQALRNANRYLYLRNRALGDRRRLLAAMSCIAIRGADAYACGAGPHMTFIVSRGRVRSLVSAAESSDVGVCEDWRDNSHVLGSRAVLSEPKFSYRQILPGDLVLTMAADDAGVLQRAGDAVVAIADEKELKVLAQDIARLLGRSTNLSAVLMRLGPDTAGLQEEPGASDVGAARKLVSSGQVFLPFRRAAKGSEARGHEGRQGRKSLPASKEGSVSRDETPRSRWPGSQSIASFSRRRSETQQGHERQSHQLLQQSMEMCRLAGALVLSLVSGLWRGGLALLRSGWQLSRRIWSWTRQHRVLERLGRACEWALIGVWAGSKGLLVRILPERQGSITTYGASSRPMARAKLVDFHASGRSRAAIGALIVLSVLIVVAVSALRINSRPGQADLETLTAQAEEKMLLAEREVSEHERMALLQGAKDVVDQATAIQADNIELTELSKRLGRQWDAATGVVRVASGPDQVLTIAEGSPRRILIHQDQLYVLDATGRRLSRYGLDEEGMLVTDQEPWIWELQGEADNAFAERIVDIEWADAAYGRLTPALLMLTMEGSLLELNSARVVRDVSISDVLRWENAQAIRTYYGSLYVLDPGRENIIKYIPTGDDYEYPPVNYFQGSADIQWANVVDMAADDAVYLLLSNGSIMRFAGEEPEVFTLQGLYPPLEHPVAMFAPPDSRSVFVAEPAQARIVEFSRDGQFIRQFGAVSDGEDPFEALQAFGVDPRHDRLFIATDAGIHSVSLPSLQ